MAETGNLFMYFTQGVAATEVEVDTLTGDHTVLRVDIHVGTSFSLSPGTVGLALMLVF
jgi:xanthine dehydrogenase/oxidase